MIRRYDTVLAVAVIACGGIVGALLGWLRGLDLDIDV